MSFDKLLKIHKGILTPSGSILNFIILPSAALPLKSLNFSDSNFNILVKL